MGDPIKLKRGDLTPIPFWLKKASVAVPLSATTDQILFSGKLDVGTGATLWFERDVTAYALAHGDSDFTNGKIVVPLYDGRTDVGPTDSQAVADKTVDGKVNVTVPADADPEIEYQEIWRTKAGETEPWYFIARFAEGTYSASPYVDNTADADLVQVLHNELSEDRSRTQGEAAVLPTPTTPVAALAGAGAGNVDNGTHLYAVVNKRHPDTDTIQNIRIEVIVVDMVNDEPETFPEEGFELLSITEDVPA